MAIELLPGTRVQGHFQTAIQEMTQSTATAAQSLSTTIRVSALGAGTATGFSRNIYTLSATTEGVEKFVYMPATGEAILQFTMSTGMHYLGTGTATGTGGSYAAHFTGAATGALVFTAKNQWVRMLCLDEGWQILGGHATFATATS